MMDWVKDNESLLMMIGAAVASLATAAWALYRHIDEKKSASATTRAPAGHSYQAVHLYGIPFAEYEAALLRREEEVRARLNKASEAGTGQAQDLERELAGLKAELDRRKERIEELTRLVDEIRADLVPKELDGDGFPPSLSVRSFVKGRELTVNVLPDLTTLVFRRGVGVLWTAFLTAALVHLFNFPALAGVPIFALLFYLIFYRYYVRFNFQKRKIDVITPGAAVWGRVPHPVEVVARRGDAGWLGEVRAEGLRIAYTEPKLSEEEARAELLPFGKALNFALGVPVLSLDWLSNSPLAPEQPVN